MTNEQEVQAAVRRAVDEVRVLGIETGLLQAQPKVHQSVVILTALLLMKERLIEYNNAKVLGRPTFAPKAKAKASLTV